MRLIDADKITATLEIAISMMENTKSIIGVENLPVIDVEIKAYTDILKGIKEQPTVQPERTEKRTESHTCDLISRQAAIDALRVAYWDDNIQSAKDDPCIVDAMTDWAIRQVKALPPAQPEPKEGHWITYETPDGGEQYECSRCGVLWEFNDGTPEDNEAYFCPKCGTKMKGETT